MKKKIISIICTDLTEFLSLSTIFFFIVLYVFFSYKNTRFDLTSDKRYTLSTSSIEIIKSINTPVNFEIFLSGDLPPGMRYLKSEINRIMMDVKDYNNKNIKYQFIDLDNFNDIEKNLYIDRLVSNNINPTDLVYNTEKGRIIKRIFPGILITSNDKEESILLLTGDKNFSASEIINQSIENLEFEIVSSLFFLSQSASKNIGFITGHDELDNLEINSIKSSLEKKYYFETINIENSFDRIDDFNLLIVAKPKSSFSMKDKFFLDQFLMSGGRILFLVDALGVNLNDSSIYENLAYEYDHKLDDLLYKYGIRINKNYIKDFNSALFPVVIGNFGNNPNIIPLPFPFFPEISNFGNHSIVKNLGSIITKFVSSIDTVNNDDSIKKIPLLYTSDFSFVDNFPVVIRLNDLAKSLNQLDFNDKSKVIGILLEGKFSSYFNNRLFNYKIKNKNFLSNSLETKIVVISDGDIIRNDIVNNRPIELGNDLYQKKKYANIELIQNIIFYLLEDDNLIDAKMKDLNYYQLDKNKVNIYKLSFQYLNLLLPIIFCLIIFVLRFFYRKNKYNFKN